MSDFLKQFCQQQDIPFGEYSAAFNQVYFKLIRRLNEEFQRKREISTDNTSLIVGLNGAQGSGKSTLVLLMEQLLNQHFNLKTLSLSIDDLYFGAAQRKTLAQQIHPLMITRGVPGTHDISLGLNILEKLAQASSNTMTLIPQFEKATDDRKPQSHWKQFIGKPDIILFEGWCVGSKPQSLQQLSSNANWLEQQFDAEMIWRNYVNRILSNEYQKIFDQIDHLIFLKPPNFECIHRWREQQENRLIAKLKRENKPLDKTMKQHQLNYFMAHFERITQHNLQVLPQHANQVIELDENRHPTFGKNES